MLVWTAAQSQTLGIVHAAEQNPLFCGAFWAGDAVVVDDAVILWALLLGALRVQPGCEIASGPYLPWIASNTDPVHHVLVFSTNLRFTGVID